MTQQKNQKEPFYIFLGISGVLCNYQTLERFHGPFLPKINYPVLTKDCVTAFNYLLKNLEQKYDTKLIITSKVRKDLPACISYLHFHGLDYDKPIFATTFKDGSRSQKILEFMESENLTPLKKPSLKIIAKKLLTKAEQDEKFKNYLIINKKDFSLALNFPKSNIIQTKADTEGLTIEQVIKFLNSINIKTEETISFE